jgi:hypothetical protein
MGIFLKFKKKSTAVAGEVAGEELTWFSFRWRGARFV